MGEKLVRYFKYIDYVKGLEGKVELAQITRIPSCMAQAEPETPQKIQVFKKAIEEITDKPAPDL